MINLFIPSYHRATNVKTAKYFLRLGYDPKKIHVFIDSEADDKNLYETEMKKLGVNLHVFDMQEARNRYDYVHRPSPGRRSAGQARNMFQDFAKQNNIDFYVVQDDDTARFELRKFGIRVKSVINLNDLLKYFDFIEKFMRKNKIGLFGLTQGGDYYGGSKNQNILKSKVMNTSFYLMPYVYRGERGVQDNDTSLFCGIHNEGLFTGSLNNGLILEQTLSATSKGGLTDLYHELKLLNKALITPIQFPSAIHAVKQPSNGGRIHHRINYKYLAPKLIKGERSNISWETYPEDYPFTNEPKRIKKK